MPIVIRDPCKNTPNHSTSLTSPPCALFAHMSTNLSRDKLVGQEASGIGGGYLKKKKKAVLECNVLGQLKLDVPGSGRVSSVFDPNGPLSCRLYHLTEAWWTCPRLPSALPRCKTANRIQVWILSLKKGRWLSTVMMWKLEEKPL